MPVSMSDFKITRGQKQCAVCEHKFTHGERYTVALAATAEEGVFARHDLCVGCWQRQGPGDFVAFWPAEYTTAAKPVLLDPDLLWQIFHRARAPQTDAAQAADMGRFAYVAALGLLRLKQLKLKNTRREGARETLVFETPGKRSKDRVEYSIENPELDEQGVERIQDRLSELA